MLCRASRPFPTLISLACKIVSLDWFKFGFFDKSYLGRDLKCLNGFLEWFLKSLRLPILFEKKTCCKVRCPNPWQGKERKKKFMRFTTAAVFETGLAKAPAFEIQADVKALLRHCSYLGPPLELWRHSCVKSHQIFTTAAAQTLKVGNGHLLPLSVYLHQTGLVKCLQVTRFWPDSWENLGKIHHLSIIQWGFSPQCFGTHKN